ncbi:MAG: arginine N-succinyltransferase [Pseudomonadales bacterium]|nr:arginine N-succinyltransferase [Pseudomonadales bacterium]NRA14441.1 arginine N-succinyltransferase [Oceanospirillaceae bacterium]
MLVVRPVRFDDLPDIEHLAVTAGDSMTTLPNNRDHLAQLINTTQQSLQHCVTAPAGQSYHFVLADSDSGELHGIAGIEACVGYNSPFYSYRCDQAEHVSTELQIQNTIATLRLCQDYEGASRLYTFFLPSKKVGPESLRLLSLCRLMFIGQHLQRFNQLLILELQGVLDADRKSPFWQALGQHFFDMDFHRANYLTGINAKGFIADLMPRYPVYVPLLSESAQRVMGCARPDMQPAQKLLSAEGFSEHGYISIFDGGPTLQAQTQQLRSIAKQFAIKALIAQPATAANNSKVLISNTLLQNYACIYAELDLADIRLSAAQAEQLQVSDGDILYILPLAET